MSLRPVLAVVALSACRTPSPPPVPSQRPPLAAAPAPAAARPAGKPLPPLPPQPTTPGVPLVRVAQDALSELRTTPQREAPPGTPEDLLVSATPTRFAWLHTEKDSSRQAQVCHVYDAEVGAYVGDVPPDSCRWMTQSCAQQSPPPVAAPAGKRCRPLWVRAPADGAVAVGCLDAALVEVHDATGRITAKLRFGQGRGLKELCWGPAGLLALAEHTVGHDHDDFQRIVELHQHRGGGSVILSEHVIDEAYAHSRLWLAPPGRFLLEFTSSRGHGDSLQVTDLLHRERPNPLNAEVLGGEIFAEAGEEPGRWLPGPPPIWRVKSYHQDDGAEERDEVLWDVTLTADSVALRQTTSRAPATDRAARDTAARDGGAKAPPPAATLSPDGRTEGAGAGKLRRVADGVELRLLPGPGAPCLITSPGWHECGIDRLDSLVLRAGTDPLTALVLRGDQVAHRAAVAELGRRFASGAPLPALLAPNPGGPPELEQDGPPVRQQDGVAVAVLAHDRGAGVGKLRVYRGSTLEGAPRPLVAETRLSLTLSARPCSPYRVYACDAADAQCGPALLVNPCQPGGVGASGGAGATPAAHE